MRTLKSTDLFAGLRVVKAIGVKEEMKEFAQALADGAVTAKTQREMGVELMLGILANCGDKAAETAFYEFLSAPMEIPVEELQEMDLIKFAEAIKDLVEYIDMEAWKAFFTSLADLMKKTQ